MKPFEIDVQKILLEHGAPFFVREGGYFVLSIANNYINIDHKESKDTGSSKEYFSFHPENICEGKGICIWCGSTLFNDEAFNE